MYDNNRIAIWILCRMLYSFIKVILFKQELYKLSNFTNHIYSILSKIKYPFSRNFLSQIGVNFVPANDGI